MGTAPTQSAATVGGLLNLTRGLGTALGVAAVTLAYHLGSDQHFTARGEQLAVVVLLAAALLAGLSSWLATGSLATAP